MKSCSIVLGIAFALCLFMQVGSAYASPIPPGTPILLIVDDSNPKSVVRSSGMVKKVVAEIKQRLTEAGYPVIDSNLLKQIARWELADRLTRLQLAQVAAHAKAHENRNIHPEIMLTIRVTATARANSFGTEIQASALGEITALEENRHITSFESGREISMQAPGCTGACMESAVGGMFGDFITSLVTKFTGP